MISQYGLRLIITMRFFEADGNRKRAFREPGQWCFPDFYNHVFYALHNNELMHEVTVQQTRQFGDLFIDFVAEDIMVGDHFYS